MKTAKLIVGIAAIVISIVLFVQSSLVVLGEALLAEEEASGGFGIFASIPALIGGIVSIAARKSKGGSVVCLIVFAFSGAIGLACSAGFPDLAIWGSFFLFFAAIHLLFLFTGRNSHEEN
ncbi:MAG: hypothetical protein SPJ34_03410 [Candidatus Ornithospirochaeta sp.]|nr:hypothetical protein [Candidatus Ornithospirochaeta sp.]